MNVQFKTMCKRPLFWIIVGFLALSHGGSTFLQVPKIQPNLYATHAVDLTVTPKWRYGYAAGFHGAHLVKTRNVPGSVPLFPEQDADLELSAAMSKQLSTYPIRATLETLFYVCLVAYAFLAVPRLRNRLIPEPARCGRRMLFEGTAWALGWTLICLPILCLGYEASVFTTWAGPGAASSSGPYPLITGIPGETISYRPLLEIVSLFPVTTVAAAGLGGCLPDIPTGQAIWISGVLFYGMGVALLRAVRCGVVSVVTKRNAGPT